MGLFDSLRDLLAGGKGRDAQKDRAARPIATVPPVGANGAGPTATGPLIAVSIGPPASTEVVYLTMITLSEGMRQSPRCAALQGMCVLPSSPLREEHMPPHTRVRCECVWDLHLVTTGGYPDELALYAKAEQAARAFLESQGGSSTSARVNEVERPFLEELARVQQAKAAERELRHAEQNAVAEKRRQAARDEQAAPEAAVAAYLELLDTKHGTGHDLNRVSLVLERMKRTEEALRQARRIAEVRCTQPEKRQIEKRILRLEQRLAKVSPPG